jgi:hypothetical protein
MSQLKTPSDMRFSWEAFTYRYVSELKLGMTTASGYVSITVL